jgi:hypothetical protein
MNGNQQNNNFRDKYDFSAKRPIGAGSQNENSFNLANGY